MTRALRLAGLVLAAVVIGAAIAALPSPPDDACMEFAVEEGTAWTTGTQAWPYGTVCELSDGRREFLGASAVETVVVTVAVFALLLLAARRWAEPWARALAAALALLGLIGLLAHALGYPGLPMFAVVLGLPLVWAVRRNAAASFVMVALAVPVWFFFDLTEQAWIGVPLAIALATLAGAKVRGWPEDLAGTPAPPR